MGHAARNYVSDCRTRTAFASTSSASRSSRLAFPPSTVVLTAACGFAHRHQGAAGVPSHNRIIVHRLAAQTPQVIVMGKFIDITGQRFGRLVVQERVGKLHGGALWRCLCDCGKTYDVSSNSLRHGGTNSCGCLMKEAQRDSRLRNRALHPDTELEDKVVNTAHPA